MRIWAAGVGWGTLLHLTNVETKEKHCFHYCVEIHDARVNYSHDSQKGFVVVSTT